MTPADDLIRELERTRDETLRCFSLGESELNRTYGPGRWSVRFLLHHLADSECVLLERVKRVISEPRQVLWVYDQDAWALGLDYARLPLELSKPLYEAARAANIHLAGRHYQRDGAREWVHSVTGLRTLKDEMDKVASHNEHHWLRSGWPYRRADAGACAKSALWRISTSVHRVEASCDLP